jgi:hypothetical protein
MMVPAYATIATLRCLMNGIMQEIRYQVKLLGYEKKNMAAISYLRAK